MYVYIYIYIYIYTHIYISVCTQRAAMAAPSASSTASTAPSIQRCAACANFSPSALYIYIDIYIDIYVFRCLSILSALPPPRAPPPPLQQRHPSTVARPARTYLRRPYIYTHIYIHRYTYLGVCLFSARPLPRPAPPLPLQRPRRDSAARPARISLRLPPTRAALAGAAPRERRSSREGEMPLEARRLLIGMRPFPHCAAVNRNMSGVNRACILIFMNMYVYIYICIYLHRVNPERVFASQTRIHLHIASL